MASIFLTAEWRKLIMAQYAVEPSVLAPWLPSGLELDLFRDRCYVSLVGFLFDEVRIKGVVVPFHKRFEEINLRFYVKPVGPEAEGRRGVVFIREFVPRLAITLIAKQFYEEPYATLATRSSVDSVTDHLSVRYDWQYKKQWHSLAVEASPIAKAITPGSEEEFITEHYWGYTKRSDGSTSAYEVEHPRWQVYPVTKYAVAADFGALYGPAFAMLNQQRPVSVLVAEGSEVCVRSGQKLAQ